MWRLLAAQPHMRKNEKSMIFKMMFTIVVMTLGTVWNVYKAKTTKNTDGDYSLTLDYAIGCAYTEILEIIVYGALFISI